MEQILIDEWNITSTIEKLNKICKGTGNIIPETVDYIFEHNRKYPSRPLFIEIVDTDDYGVFVQLITKAKTRQLIVTSCLEMKFEHGNLTAICDAIDAFQAGLKIMGRLPRTVKTL